MIFATVIYSLSPTSSLTESRSALDGNLGALKQDVFQKQLLKRGLKSPVLYSVRPDLAYSVANALYSVGR